MIDAGVTDSAQCVEAMEETLILLAEGDYRMAGATANSHGAQISFPASPVMSMRFLDLESSYFLDSESRDFVDAESPRFLDGESTEFLYWC